jgi:hypothetical protein
LNFVAIVPTLIETLDCIFLTLIFFSYGFYSSSTLFFFGLGEGNDNETSDCEVPNLGQQFYLGTEGSDTWDGTSPVHFDGTNSGPWATLSHAITQIRTHRPHKPGPEDLASLNILTGWFP